MSKMMHRKYDTDDGTRVLVLSKRSACVVESGGTKMRKMKRSMSAKQRKMHKAQVKMAEARLGSFCKEFVKESHIRSPTQAACDSVQEGSYIPKSMGGTNGGIEKGHLTSYC